MREDRRHIQDADVKLLRKELKIPLNLEMAATDEMVRIACQVKPNWSCLVPEKRQELTTEGGLDLKKNFKNLKKAIPWLQKAGVRVSLFVEPSLEAVRLSHELGADAVELHTGRFCKSTSAFELKRIREASLEAKKLGLHAHAGHGLDYENIRFLSSLHLVEEYNIGHSIVCRAVLVGLERAVREMISSMLSP